MRKHKLIPIILMLLFIGCTANLGNVPWQLDIKNWSPEKRANFFLKSWLAEKANYDALNALEKKSPALLKVLETKREILEQSRKPIRAYSTIVKSGGMPDAATEQAIIDWLRSLQNQYIYGG